MVKKAICFLICLCLFPLGAGASSQKPTEISAAAAVVMDPASGTVLFQKNADTQMAVASTTKIMTTLLLLEQGNWERPLTVKEEWVKVEGTSMGLLPGDTVTPLALCYGMMLSSGNDAANVAAISHSGSLENFSAAMNQKAAALGMNNTRFVTPSGLDEGDPYSSAYDMALLTAHALKNQAFRETVSKPSAKISYGNPPYPRTLKNHNRLLTEYEGCIGVKTGFTKKAGRCLVSAAVREGATLICVTLKAPDDWNDHKKLLDYGFSQMEQLTHSQGTLTLPVVGCKETQIEASYPCLSHAVPAAIKSEISFRISVSPFLYAPITAGQPVGKVELLYQGAPLAWVPITANQTAAYLPPQFSFWEKFCENFRLFFA